MQRYERGILLIKRREILGLANGRFEIAVGLAVMHGRPAAFAVQDQLYAPQIALHLADARDRSGRIEYAGRDLVDILSLRDRKHLAVGVFEGGFNGAQCGRTARANRRRDARKQHGVAQRQDGQTHPV